MNNPVETLEYKDHSIEIHYDTSPENPRKHFDNLGTFCVTMWFDESDVDPRDIRDDPQRLLELEIGEPVALMLPIYKYEHGMIALRTTPFNIAWDSGQIGWIYVTRRKILENYGRKRLTRQLLEQVEQLLDYEVVEMSNYLNGDVYGFATFSDGEMVDSCWGFYDGIEWAKRYACEEIDAWMRHTPGSRAPIIELLGA